MLEVSNYERDGATYLQGVAGWVTGTPAGDLVVGDTMVWNGGSTSKVVQIVRETKAFVWVESECSDGLYTRKLKKSRIVARPIAELGAVSA